MLKQHIQAFCESLGLDTLGFIPCRKFEELIPFYERRQSLGLQNEFEEQAISKKIDPTQYMEDGKTILSIAFPYCEVKNPKVSKNGFSIYTQRLDYHRVVKSYLEQIVAYIESLGGKAVGLVDSNALPERYIAYLAGVGFIGRNNMVITKKYGSYVFLGEIITNLDIPCEDKRSFDTCMTYSECGQCEKCIKACPTKSISHTTINPNICLSYVTQKKDLDDSQLKLLKGNVFGCDFCQLVCPYNQDKAFAALENFKILECMVEDVEVYARMDNKYFKEYIQKTSCGWRGKNVIKRNALIAMKRQKRDINHLRGDSPYINDYVDRLNRLFETKDQ